MNRDQGGLVWRANQLYFDFVLIGRHCEHYLINL